MRKALIIHRGKIRDKGDVLHIARALGREALGVKKVRVLPWVAYDPYGDFVVEVEPLEEETPYKPTGVVGPRKAK